MNAAPIEVVGSLLEGKSDAGQTPGMQRHEIVGGPDLWIGVAKTPPGVVSGWHHHGEWESFVFMARGSALLEFGPDGGESLELTEGMMARVPSGAVHRETNTGSEENFILVYRRGSGQATFNVENPHPKA